MRMRKTAEKKRGTYIYYVAEGKNVELVPGQDGVNEGWIALLHALDDEEVDANRRNSYRCPVHYENYLDDNGDDVEDRNSYLADSKYDPLEYVLDLCDKEERYARNEKMKMAVLKLTDKQQETVHKKFYLEMSNVDIAAEDGVSEAAIRNRLTKIYEQIKKKNNFF